MKAECRCAVPRRAASDRPEPSSADPGPHGLVGVLVEDVPGRRLDDLQRMGEHVTGDQDVVAGRRDQDALVPGRVPGSRLKTHRRTTATGHEVDGAGAGVELIGFGQGLEEVSPRLPVRPLHVRRRARAPGRGRSRCGNAGRPRWSMLPAAWSPCRWVSTTSVRRSASMPSSPTSRSTRCTPSGAQELRSAVSLAAPVSTSTSRPADLDDVHPERQPPPVRARSWVRVEQLRALEDVGVDGREGLRERQEERAFRVEERRDGGAPDGQALRHSKRTAPQSTHSNRLIE